MIKLAIISSLVVAVAASPQPTVQGQVQVKIDTEGQCQIVKSSGDAKLDQKTCDLVKTCAAKSANLKEALTQCATIDRKSEKAVR
jgi:outer membrane biosynthesis protein TonB